MRRNSGVPDGGLADLAVDGQVGLVVLGEGGPWNWDFAVTTTGITGQEETVFHQFKTDQTSSYHFRSAFTSPAATLTSLNHFRPVQTSLVQFSYFKQTHTSDQFKFCLTSLD